MSQFVARIAWCLALVLWIAFLPVWFGALMTMTLFSTLKMIGGIAAGQTGRNEQALDDLAGQWPGGLTTIMRNIAGRPTVLGETAKSVPGPPLLTTAIYATIFWAAAYASWRAFVA